MLFFVPPCNACTAFGAITESGTIMGKNRDYYYNPQKFERMAPIQQFHNWYDNNYNHNNEFYALTSKNDVLMGVNQNGLTAIEEDSPRPLNADKNRMFQQPQNGTAEGMVLYGILQNFNTVDEIIPFLQNIFSVAGPHFYQISDAKKILTVEVAYGANNTDLKRKFAYKVFSNKNDFFTHTNTYLSPEFTSLNNLSSNQDSLNGAINRLQKITYLISHSQVRNIDVAANWFMDTNSNLSSKKDKNQCLNTSLFRSNLQGFKSVDLNIGNDKIYGTVSSMIVSNNGDLKDSYLYLKMIDSITTENNNKQLIKYRVLYTNLFKLFEESKPLFIKHEFVRNPPNNQICR